MIWFYTGVGTSILQAGLIEDVCALINTRQTVVVDLKKTELINFCEPEQCICYPRNLF